jgi:hypothetical protein
MSKSKLFSQQRLQSIKLRPNYLPESFSKMILNLTDAEGNALALYESEYLKLTKYLKEQGLTVKNSSLSQLLDAIEKSKVKVIKYFTPEMLKKFELMPITSDFSFTGNIVTSQGVVLKKEGHENAVVMYDHIQGKECIYTHPKIRSIPGNINHTIPDLDSETKAIEEKVSPGLVGVSHSSLSQGNKVKFAGTFMHTEKTGWVILNTTGHYATRAYNTAAFLEVLETKGFNLNGLMVKLWIPNSKNAGAEEKNHTIIYENALDFLKRIRSSRQESSASLEGLSVSDERMADSAFGQSSDTAKIFKKT